MKEEASSNTVSIMAIPTATPSQWSFRERSLILEFTATWCGPCSLMKAGIKMLENEGWDDGYVVEAHTGDELTINSIIGQLQTIAGYGGGIPLVTFNFADSPRQTSAKTVVSANAQLIKTLTNQANNAYPCTAGATAVFSANEENRLIVSSNVAISENGEYKVSCWLLENNITAVQNTGGYQEPLDYDINNHINVLRAVHNEDPIGVKVNAEAHDILSFEWNFNLATLLNGNAEDSHVLVIISKKEDNGKFIVNNVIKCPFNGAVGFEYAE